MGFPLTSRGDMAILAPNMGGPLSGIQVVEVAIWLAAPAAAAILADWGARVIKVEPPTGDPMRQVYKTAFSSSAEENPFFEQANRGKWSVVLDLKHEKARDVMGRLLKGADVFITNLRPRVLQRMGLSYDDVSALNPRLVYCQVTGYGRGHQEENRPAYDIGAVWARAGLAHMGSPPGAAPSQPPTGIGDNTTAMVVAGAVSAALLARERTGQGQYLHVSLLRVAAYMGNWDILRGARLGTSVRPQDRYHMRNPLANCYQAKDGKWFWLLLVEGDRHWPNLCRAIGREDLRDDPRFQTLELRSRHAPELVAELDQTFALKTREEWAEVFRAHDIWWEPVNSIDDLLADPLARAAGVFVDVPTEDGALKPLVASPADFGGTVINPGPAPQLGQHTEQVLLELGYQPSEILALRDEGAIL